MSESKHYTDLERLRALAVIKEFDGNVLLASQQLDIPYRVLARWAKQTNVALDERLERIAHQLIAVMPDKLEEADLQQITRALSLVLDKIQITNEDDDRGDVYEKLVHLMDSYAAEKRSASAGQPPDEAGSP